MWVYVQESGRLYDASGSYVATGYSGSGVHKNDPSSQQIHDEGPIPQGFYGIQAPEDSPRTGPFTLPLAPDAANEMFGRSLFRIHGDSSEHPGAASDGCIILPRDCREQIWSSGDHELEVISSSPLN